ncbi:hypothetical protein ACR79N_17795 [Sphingobacterium siyangense]|uniref:hypothetical protein n=1 Tax=Sphingobacterium siyangense TaxID=459529 RepID=UPI003DA62B2D
MDERVAADTVPGGGAMHRYPAHLPADRTLDPRPIGFRPGRLRRATPYPDGVAGKVYQYIPVASSGEHLREHYRQDTGKDAGT